MLHPVIDHATFTPPVRALARCMFGDEEDATLRQVVEHHLTHPAEQSGFILSSKGRQDTVPWVKGAYFHEIPLVDETGAQLAPSRVMVLGAYPTDPTSPLPESTADLLTNIFMEAGVQGWKDWYFTWLVKFYQTEHSTASVPAKWIADCLPWLHQELIRVRPEYVLCFGTPVYRAITGESRKAADLYGTVTDTVYTFPDGSQLPLKALGFPGISAMEGMNDSSRTCGKVLAQMQALQGALECTPQVVVQRRHIVVRTEEELKSEVDRIQSRALTNPKRRIIAVDMEWEGDYPQQEGAHLLTVQFSSLPGEATVVVLHDNQGENPERSKLVKQLKRLFLPTETWSPRIGGHFLRADLPWLLSLGMQPASGPGILDAYAPSRNVEQCRDEGGWDTSLAYHAYDEDDSYGLKYLATAELGFPHYEFELQDYITKTLGMKMDGLTGFGCIPDAILHPYGAWDADATRTLVELLFYGYGDRPALLAGDVFGNPCWQPYWLAHSASLGFLEMEQTGILLDKTRFAALSDRMYEVSEILLEKVREILNWPEFNPNSAYDVRGAMFGHKFSEGFSESRGKYRTMPESARTIGLEPEYTTRTKKPWDELGEDELEQSVPAADKNVFKLAAQRDPTAALLQDLRTVRGVLRSPLSAPVTRWDRDGYHRLYPSGLYSKVREDGKIHTKYSQLMVTGRASSSKPPLQNIGKNVEANYRRIMGTMTDEGPTGAYLDLLGEPLYLYPLRSILRADPDHVLVCADFGGAELAVMAWASQDEAMTEHVRRNALPEASDEYYDIHSNIAVQAFRLDCEPTKKGLASIGMKHMRGAAKTVVFGIAYGRGPVSIALQCNADGIPLSVDQAKELIQSFFGMYPRVQKYLEQCKKNVTGRGYVATLFGRYRRFFAPVNARDNAVVAKQQREGANAPIQGTVADAINLSIRNLLLYRKRRPELRYRLALQIHDELILQVHKDDAAEMIQRVLPCCMVEHVNVPVQTAQGVQYHHFNIGADVYIHWGEPLTEEAAQRELNVSVDYLTKGKQEDGF